MIRAAPLLYWFPGVAEPPSAYAARFRDATGNPRGAFSRNSEGPEERLRGCLAAPFHDVLAVYTPATQRWDRVAKGVWIGTRPDTGPADFARPEQFTGYRRTLGDGQQWLIPIANPFAALCSLPSHDVLRDGEWRREIADRYRALSDRAAVLSAEVRVAVLEGRSEVDLDLPDEELRGLMADVLALNYDLTLAEMSALRLFGPAVYWPVIAAFIDWDGQREALLQAMGGGTSSGPFGGTAPENTSATPSTAPPAAGTA